MLFGPHHRWAKTAVVSLLALAGSSCGTRVRPDERASSQPARAVDGAPAQSGAAPEVLARESGAVPVSPAPVESERTASRAPRRVPVSRPVVSTVRPAGGTPKDGESQPVQASGSRPFEG